MRSRGNTSALLLLAATLASAAEPAGPPVTADRMLPDWLWVGGEFRTRYETLDGQFRRGGAGGDQLLLFRTLIHGKATFDPVTFGVEIQDSRTYLGDDGTPISPSLVNPVDFLQVYGSIRLPEVFDKAWRPTFTLGRQTISIGSKRQIERPSFANVIRAYTGGYLRAQNLRGDEFHAFLAVPVGRFPRDRESLLDNQPELDEEEWNRQIWGLHYRRADTVPGLAEEVWAEVFAYGLHETDTDSRPTPNRNYVTPGFRVFRPAEPGRWDVDVEAALRYGTRRATALPTDTEDLDVFASMLYASVGYTFDAPWSPRLALQYYWASGDEDPNDSSFGQFERLFGSRRTDLNNTSIYGPLTPANLSAPGLRLSVEPNERIDARLTYSAAFLASDTDAWVVARLRDPTGQSGSFIGHAFDSRARFWLAPGNVQLSVGGSALLHGEFSDNAPGSPAPGTTLFGYTSLAVYF